MNESTAREWPRCRALRRDDVRGTGRAAAAHDASAAMSPTSIFASASTPADAIVEVSHFVLAVTAGVFVVVGSLLVYAIARFRKRPHDADSEPAQVYGSNAVELAWTVIPVLI